MTKKHPNNVPGIYTITCLVTQTVYVGQSAKIKRRWNTHRGDLEKGTHRNIFLRRAWAAYGADAFVFAIHSDMSHLPEEARRDAMDLAEAALVASLPKTYNVMSAGESNEPASARTREIWSEIRKDMWADPAFREKRSADTKELYNQNPEWKAARDAAVKASLSTPEAKSAASSRFLKMWRSDEHRAEQSARREANWQDPAYRDQQSDSRKKAWADPEIRAKRIAGLRAAAANPTVKAARKAGQDRSRAQASEAHKAKWQDPEYRERQSKSRSSGQSARYLDPVERAAHSARMKEAWARRKSSAADAP
jgi:group I intron endonuclease